MTQQVELFYDFRSPYSYLAFTQLLAMDIDLVLRPMQILKVMEKVGNVPTTIICKAKGQYARADLSRWANRYGIGLNPSDMAKNDGDACSRAVLAANSSDEARNVTLALYQACWSQGKALTNTADILEAIAVAGIDSARIAARIDAPDVVTALATNTEEAAERGVFGSPTMIVGDAMFFGNDRLDFLREELERREKAA